MADFTVYNNSPEGLFLPYYMQEATGGLNSCILGNTPQGENIGITGANVLNNCVSWCQGRMAEVYNEVSGTQANPVNPFRACNNDAHLWYGSAVLWGFSRARRPSIGSIGCYRKREGSGYIGHVVFVERYNAQGIWECSESHYYFDGDENLHGSWDYTTLTSNFMPQFLASESGWSLQGFIKPDYGVTLTPSDPISRPTPSTQILFWGYRKNRRRIFQ